MKKWRARCCLAAAAAAAAVCCLSVPAPARAKDTPAYRIVKSVPLGAPDQWDYVTLDPATHRVYVAHQDELTVVDGATGALVGRIKGFPGGSHGIAISTPNGRGYADDGDGGVVKSFDLQSLNLRRTIKAEADADAMVLDPASGHIFVMNGDSGKITVIDPAGDTAIATVDAGGKLEFAASDNAGNLYVNGAGDRVILRVDTRTNQVTARWPVPDCESPHGMAIDPQRHRVFVSCLNARLLVIDTDHGAVVTTLPIGYGTDAAAFDPVRRRVFSSNGRDGTLTVIQQGDADSYQVSGTIKTQVTGRTMAIDPSNGRLFIAAAAVDPSSPPDGRLKAQPGSLKLLFLDPVAPGH